MIIEQIANALKELRHLTSLVPANLIVLRREGRTLFCVVNYEKLQAVITFFQDDCCIGSCCIFKLYCRNIDLIGTCLFY